MGCLNCYQDDFHFGLYDLDYDVFGCHLESHTNRVPSVAEAGIQVSSVYVRARVCVCACVAVVTISVLSHRHAYTVDSVRTGVVHARPQASGW